MLQPVDRMPIAPAIPPITVAGAAHATTGTNQVASASGGYVFSPEEIDAVIKAWEDLYDEVETDERDAHEIASVKAPGLEFASGDFANAAGPSGETLVDQVQRMKKYVGDYIMALKDAKRAVQEQEEQAAADATNAGDSLL